MLSTDILLLSCINFTTSIDTLLLSCMAYLIWSSAPETKEVDAGSVPPGGGLKVALPGRGSYRANSRVGATYSRALHPSVVYL